MQDYTETLAYLNFCVAGANSKVLPCLAPQDRGDVLRVRLHAAQVFNTTFVCVHHIHCVT